MSKALTEEAYWNGIKGNNTDKNSVTSDLNPFVEILQDENGELKYVRGTANITFAGIDVDDLDGWYLTEKFREFKSSKPGVVSHELLRITPPEYNTKVKYRVYLRIVNSESTGINSVTHQKHQNMQNSNNSICSQYQLK